MRVTNQPIELIIETTAAPKSKTKSAATPNLRKALKEAGMDSLPAAGAEILTDRVRRLISKGKCGAQEWLDIMHEAHKIGLTTSATMMFGHVETIEERFEHLVKLRLKDKQCG